VSTPAPTPSPAPDAPVDDRELLVDLEDVVKHFPVKQGNLLGRELGLVRAVDGVTLQVRAGETLGLVGESGCGKSTLARLVAGLQPVTSGRIRVAGYDVTTMRRQELRKFRGRVQMVFQDPYGSLNPRRRVGSILGEPFAIHKVAKGDERKKRVQELMARVGLSPEHYNRFPAEFSGGQRQRIGIARALALRPDLVVCDEPVSALDVSIQAQVLNLLDDLQGELGLTYLFIAHDLSVVRHVSDRVAVMYLGMIAEQGQVEDLYTRPRHPYTAALLSAVPTPETALARKGGQEATRIVLHGDVPSPINPPSGCRFHPRCPKAQERCSVEVPLLRSLPDAPEDHLVACHFPVEAGDGVAAADWGTGTTGIPTATEAPVTRPVVP
jgi:oligopeptide/dipeptide ABC transporter ATP-binding protein